MHQLTSLDAQFLAAEDGRTHGHVSALGIYDPSTAPGARLTLEAVRDLVATRIDSLAPFRWRLAPVPLNLDHPYWFDDPVFDLEFHIRELALPAPGDDRQLAEQVARLHSRPLDRGRPLWELYLIQGLSGGGSRDHDQDPPRRRRRGVGRRVAQRVVGSRPEPPHTRAPRTGAAPSSARRPGSGSSGATAARSARFGPAPLRALAATPRTLPHLDQVPTVRMLPGVRALAAGSALLTGARRRDGGVLERTNLRAPRTRFNRRIGPHRRFAFASVPLADVKAVKNAMGVTVNDVVLALSAGVLRRRLAAAGDLPTEPLLAMVPVSVRTPEQAGTFGNRVSTMIVPLPTDEPDARRRVARVNDVMRSAKQRHRAIPATLMQDANQFIPPALLARASRVVGQLSVSDPLAPPVNVVVSNVPGSPTPLYLAGARLQAQFPVSIVIDGVGVNLTVLSYRDSLDIGVIADRDLVEDAWPFIEDIKAELAELSALVIPRPKRKTRTRTARTQPKEDPK
ncbi:hypothetical membrane protein [Mycobacterium ulcerans subsp. shinshuense]|uniref:diacylglycerol O-acyltransferase n=1 Tax=Mycobacterium ulcerans subsp. shinshuense TaxID=1124626 RepID=A0A1B4Y155_MYCUL|nr:hypothetical membrane protein [Mycobacterium ulcerans subsp. shinshuense]